MTCCSITPAGEPSRVARYGLESEEDETGAIVSVYAFMLAEEDEATRRIKADRRQHVCYEPRLTLLSARFHASIRMRAPAQPEGWEAFTANTLGCEHFVAQQIAETVVNYQMMTPPFEAAVPSPDTSVGDLVPQSPPAETSGFTGDTSFPKVLRRRLDRYFTDQKLSPKADRAMWIKIAFGLAILAGSWVAIYAFRPATGWFLTLYVISGLAQTFLLLNIAHDSNHNAVSSNAAVNRALNYVFDLCGISSYMWRILHHRGHHSCVNVHGEDDALTGRGLLRFTPHEPLRPLQRFQHFYALCLYAVFSLDYVFVRDFECFFFPTHDYLKKAKHHAREYGILFAGKAFYFTYMLVLPVLLLGKPILLVLGAFLLVHLIVGLSVALVFQTTHTVDGTYFPEGRNEFENWVYHIFATTADYATTKPMVGWLTGGLNHHVVHHLCPFVCHTHYAPLTTIVKDTAAEFGVPYRQHPTMRRAVWHHLVLLKQLGDGTWS